MASIRGRHLIDVPRLPDALAEASGVRSHVLRDTEPTDPPRAVQAALATSLAECLAAIRRAKPRDPMGDLLSKRVCDLRAYRDAMKSLELLIERRTGRR